MAEGKNGLYLHGAGMVRGKKEGKEELIHVLIPMVGSRKVATALCSGGYLPGDLQDGWCVPSSL